MIILSAAVAAAISFYVSFQQPQVYQAATKIIVGTSIQSTNPNAGDLVTSGQLAQTYVHLAGTTPVMKGTVDSLGLKMNPNKLKGNVTARIIKGTELIDLRLNGSDHVRAKAHADEVAHQLTLLGPASSFKASSTTSSITTPQHRSYITPLRFLLSLRIIERFKP